MFLKTKPHHAKLGGEAPIEPPRSTGASQHALQPAASTRTSLATILRKLRSPAGRDARAILRLGAGVLSAFLLLSAAYLVWKLVAGHLNIFWTGLPAELRAALVMGIVAMSIVSVIAALVMAIRARIRGAEEAERSREEHEATEARAAAARDAAKQNAARGSVILDIAGGSVTNIFKARGSAVSNRELTDGSRRVYVMEPVKQEVTQ